MSPLTKEKIHYSNYNLRDINHESVQLKSTFKINKQKTQCSLLEQSHNTFPLLLERIALFSSLVSNISKHQLPYTTPFIHLNRGTSPGFPPPTHQDPRRSCLSTVARCLCCRTRLTWFLR